mmetsp:Transcript_20338/g.36724  ORF Transcript_20338/g.36724 Transcript_20338/m.36724 type:complete len:86 (+) Transcript_20338:659-916(+)
MTTLSLDDEGEMEQEDLESLSTMDTKAQSNTFLARVGPRRVQTLNSFLSSKSYTDTTPISFDLEDEELHDSKRDEHEDGWRMSCY